MLVEIPVLVVLGNILGEVEPRHLTTPFRCRRVIACHKQTTILAVYNNITKKQPHQKTTSPKNNITKKTKQKTRGACHKQTPILAVYNNIAKKQHHQKTTSPKTTYQKKQKKTRGACHVTSRPTSSTKSHCNTCIHVEGHYSI